ncbi:hypothetical protein GWN42_21035, partial [candidate division KSB1 bacterium]|nr:hypothetical protein [Gammaproteobacteria bacterium]NIV95205.1 hypothetical protein [candidate division KSB1 bacterium]
MAKLLNKKLPTEHAVEIKSQVINNLINNATDVVLPELTKFFKGKKLFVDGRAHELKISAVPILAKIGTVDAGILAGEVAQSSSGELAEVAEEVLVKIHGALT